MQREVAPIDLSHAGQSPSHISVDAVNSQVAIGNHNIQVNAATGAVVTVLSPREVPVPILREGPIRYLPRDFPQMLGRHDEVGSILAKLSLITHIQASGPGGIGKTALLRHALGKFADTHSVDNIVHLPAHGLAVDDILQELFESLCTTTTPTTTPVQATRAQLRELLGDLRVVVALDDLEVQRQQLDTIAEVMRNATLFTTTADRHLWGEGLALPLTGLGTDDALALFAQEFGRALAPSERAQATSLVDTLDGHPLAVQQAAADARAAARDQPDLSAWLAAWPAAQPQAVSASALSDDQHAVLAALSLADGEWVPQTVLVSATGVSNIKTVLRTLVRSQHIAVHRQSARLLRTQLTPAIGVASRAPTEAALVGALLQWATRQRDAHQTLIAHAGAVRWAQQSAAAAGHHDQVIALAYATDAAFMVGRRWGLWAAVLSSARDASAAIGASQHQAWALHQLGSRELCLGNYPQAAVLLQQALELREALDLPDAAHASRANLSHLTSSPPGWLRIGLWGLLLVAAILGAVVLLWPDSPVTPIGGGVIANAAQLDFGQLQVGATSRARSITVTNTGTEEIAILVPRLAEPADDWIVTTSCRTVPKDGSCAVQVAFAPQAGGPRDSAVEILHTGPQSAPRIVLVGTGVPPVTQGRLSPSDTRLDFGALTVGQTSRPRTLRVTNTGDTAVQIEDVQLRELDEDWMVSSSCTVVQPGRVCAFTVAFSPQAEGTRDSSFTVRHDGLDSPLRISVVGSGAAAPPGRLTAQPPQLLFTPSGTQQAGAPQTITITHVSGRPVTVYEVVIPQPAELRWAIVEQDCATIAPQQSCTIMVAFRPLEPGQSTAVLTLFHDGAASPLTVQLQGNTPPQLSAAPSTVVFAKTFVGAVSQAREITLTNIGGQDADISDIAVDDGRSQDWDIDGRACTTLAPGESCMISVAFSPVDVGPRDTALVITYADQRLVRAVLTGEGQSSID